MANYQLIALSSPVAGREQEFDSWYDQRHIPDVLDVPGFVSAQRYRLEAPMGESRWSSMVIYEVQTDDPNKTLEEIQRRIGTPKMELGAALDVPSITVFFAMATGKPHKL